MVTIVSCRSHQPIIQVPVRKVERKVTTLVPIIVPGDSASLRAIFECDSLNNVLMRELSEEKSNNVSSSHSFKDGVFDYKSKTHRDTLWLPSDTIYLSEEIPVEVEVPIVEIKMSAFQRVFFIIGLISAGFILAWFVIKIKNLNILKL